MSVVHNQQKIFLRLLADLRPHWRRDAALPARIQRLLAGSRAFGSRDRRLYRELIYTALRYLPWIEPLLDRDPALAAAAVAWLAADVPSTLAFRAALAGDWPPCPATVAGKARVLAERLPTATNRDPAHPADELPAPLPEWFREHCPAAFDPAETDALLTRAPLWLRLQTTERSAVAADFAARGWPWRQSDAIPSAARLLIEADVTASEAYRQGLVEVQDLGSQMVLPAVGIEPAGRWLDACAGAGGKTLQLAGLLGPAGRVDAHDVRPAALDELEKRARRAGIPVTNSRGRPEPGSRPAPAGPPPFATIAIAGRPGGDYDGVLVDAPCSGSGTWRRAPHLKWTTTPAQVETAARRQVALLHEFAPCARPGGRLVYATCSLSRRENEDVVAAFLSAQTGFAPEPFATTFGFMPQAGGFTLLPARHDTDGFFVASLRRQQGAPSLTRRV
jgi:16S rRNA (cytosine967-C5)-methyltransferase